jgi:hypothetical protein
MARSKSRAKTRKRQIAKDGANGIIHLDGEVSELADEHDLGSCAARRAGSSPAFPTQEGVALATLFSLLACTGWSEIHLVYVAIPGPLQ